MHIASVGTAHPPHFASQETLIRAFEATWAREHFNLRRVRQLHEAVCVGGRHLALPIEDYLHLKGFTEANDAFIRVGLQVGEDALRAAVAPLGLGLNDIDALFFATVTGVAAPSLDARLFHRTPLRADIKRTPMFGLGCVAGAAGVARLHDYLLAYPDHVAVLLTVELCSLTLQRGDLSVANLISSGLFGDGGAAVVGLGDRRAHALGHADGPRVIATKSRLYPDSERVMGWDIGSEGFKVVLDKSVPDVVLRYMRDDVDGFLAAHGLTRADIATWVCHPGGPKVLEAFQEALEIGPADLELTWRSLREVGNLSSASVLFVLRDTLAQRRQPPGSWGMLLAMGPGFCAELVLFQW